MPRMFEEICDSAIPEQYIKSAIKKRQVYIEETGNDRRKPLPPGSAYSLLPQI